MRRRRWSLFAALATAGVFAALAAAAVYDAPATGNEAVNTLGNNQLNWTGNGLNDDGTLKTEQCSGDTPSPGDILWVYNPGTATLSGDPTLYFYGDPYSPSQIDGQGNYHFVVNSATLPTPGNSAPALGNVYVDFDVQSFDDGGNANMNLLLSHGCPGERPTASNPTVSKEAEGSYDDTFEWTPTKSADTDTVHSAGGGESSEVNYTVSVSHGDSVVSNVKVTGTITVNNPNENAAITINSVSDKLSDGTICTVDDFEGEIPANGASDPIGYTCNLDAPADGLTNTATIGWADQDLSDGSHLAAGSADSPAVDVSFTANEIDTCADVTDTFGGSLGTVCADKDANPTEFKYSHTFTGDPAGTCTSHDNTATVTGEDSGTETDSNTVTVQDCQGADLTVSKTATPSYDLKYKWTIDKSVVGASSKTVDVGAPATFNYQIVVSHDAGTQSNWKVSGKITVTNPNDWEDIVADISDSLPGGTCSVTGGDDVNVPAGKSVSVDYSCTFTSNPGTGKNTGTATWDAAAAHTPNGSASGDANFDFSGVSPTNVTDECITVKDDAGTPANTADDKTLGTVCVGDPGDPTFTFTYSLTFNGPAAGTCKDYTNTASFTTNDTSAKGSDTAKVTVCSYNALTIGYWQNHLASSSKTSAWYDSYCAKVLNGTGCSSNGPWAKQKLPQSLGNYNVDTVLKAAQVFVANNCSNASSSDNNAAGCLAAQLLATKLNVATFGGSCILATITDADNFLKNNVTPSYNGPSGGPYTLNTRAQAIALKDKLNKYNNGLGC